MDPRCARDHPTPSLPLERGRSRWKPCTDPSVHELEAQMISRAAWRYHISKRDSRDGVFGGSAPDRSRTYDLRIRNPALCPV